MTFVVSVDVEPDCPPYLSTYRGIEEGIPTLLGLLREEDVRGTFFVTGDVARKFPRAVESIVAGGHELGSHGETHRAFPDLDEREAREEIRMSSQILREFATVNSFRAPYLRFPAAYLPLLEEHGYTVDSSQARYKPSGMRQRNPTRLFRLPVSITSSVLRLPRWIRDPWLSLLTDPVVVFVHPWEFVDLRSSKLRLDCRFRTGAQATECLRQVVRSFKRRGFTAHRVLDVAGSGRGETPS